MTRDSGAMANPEQRLLGTGFVPPSDFPTIEYEALYSKLAAHKDKRAHPLLTGALHAVPYRFAALAEYDESLRASLKEHGLGPGQPYRYQQERDLFGFFSSGVSALDSFCFAAFAIGALTGSSEFPLATEKHEKRVTWEETIASYSRGFPGDPIIGALKTICDSQDFKEFNLARNVLTHRAVRARSFTLQTSAPSPGTAVITGIGNGIELNEKTTPPRREKVAAFLFSGLRAVRHFVDARL